MQWKTVVIVAIFATLVAGCAGQARKDLSAAENATPTGSELNKNLYKEYVAIAKRELAEADPESAAYYSKKAIAAADGKAVKPDDFADYKVRPEYEKDLRDARTRLVAALGSPAAALKPAAAAKAQANFDCWMQEAAEPWWQPQDRAFCSKNMEDALAELKAAQPAPAPAPTAARPEEFLVFFDFDSSALTPEATAIVKSAADTAKKGGYSRIVVTGHADRAGPAEYNFALSRRRADTVEAELVRLGLPSSEIVVEAKGETEPLVPTADGVPEAQNRRVEILMR